jgi:hypothetical protein
MYLGRANNAARRQLVTAAPRGHYQPAQPAGGAMQSVQISLLGDCSAISVSNHCMKGMPPEDSV